MQKTKILVVEDDPIETSEIVKTLKKLGYTASSVAHSINEAVRRIERESTAIIFMEIDIEKDKGGIYAANEIYSRFDIPIIYISTKSDEKILKETKIANPYGFLISNSTPSKDPTSLLDTS